MPRNRSAPEHWHFARAWGKRTAGTGALSMIEAEWWEYDDTDEMADAVAGDIGFIIESAIDARGAAVIALAGGKTPLPIYAKLAQAMIDWKRVTIVPGDERIVPLGDPLSNVTAIGKIFLPKGARVIPLR